MLVRGQAEYEESLCSKETTDAARTKQGEEVRDCDNSFFATRSCISILRGSPSTSFLCGLLVRVTTSERIRHIARRLHVRIDGR